MHALVIRKPWIDMILDGSKTWEIRGKKTQIRGTIALIQGGSSLIIGTCELIDVIGPMTMTRFLNNVDKHRISWTDPNKRLPYNETFAWVLQNAKRLNKPIPYSHPRGAVIWVKLKCHIRL